MPHALSMASPGLQAIILCGPGSSFPTFTSDPDAHPKALLPIANRPMVWYPIDFCYRTGITNIILVAPPSSAAAIQTAMDTNPHLTSLPIPKPDLLAPKDLDQTTGTASIFRLPEVRAAIRGDFVVLPCDLVCETGGEQMVESWLINQTGDAIANSIGDDGVSHMNRNDSAQRRLHGGISVYYNTKDNLSAKGEETDFIATSSAELDAAAPRSSVPSPLSKLLYSVPKDTLNDITDAKKSFPIRHSLLRSHPRLRLQSSHRDAHLYILPYWVLDMIDKNEHMDSLGEDAIGWWAKAGWQEGLATKLGLESILLATKSREGNESPTDINHDIDDCHVRDKSTTWTTEIPRADLDPQDKRSSLVVPPLLAYFHSSKTTADDNASQSILRRVDTAPLLLNISLALAKLESIEESGKQASALAHQSKIAYPAGIAARTTITRADCLLAENVTVEEKSAIKECVIGANCQIKTGAKLTRCVLMEGVVVGKGCKLTGCILGKRSEVGEECVLVDCEVQENLLIEARTEDKGVKLMSSEGMEATEQEMQEFENEAGMDHTDNSASDSPATRGSS